MLGGNHWGQGYATEAVRAALDFCFRLLHAPCVFAWCDADNPASARVLEKAGMRTVGHRSYVRRKDGHPSERVEYEVSSQEWEVIH